MENGLANGRMFMKKIDLRFYEINSNLRCKITRDLIYRAPDETSFSYSAHVEFLNEKS